MSLTNIVSGIVKKESKVDHKKLAYFFKDANTNSLKLHPVGLFLRIMKPESVAILSVQQEFSIDDNVGERSVDLPRL